MYQHRTNSSRKMFDFSVIWQKNRQQKWNKKQMKFVFAFWFLVTYVAYWLAVVYLNAGKWSFDRTSMIHQITLYHRTAKGIPFIPYDIISINAHICLHSVRYIHTHTLWERERECLEKCTFRLCFSVAVLLLIQCLRLTKMHDTRYSVICDNRHSKQRYISTHTFTVPIDKTMLLERIHG